MKFFFTTKEMGIDLGTSNTLIYIKGKGVLLREPSMVAIDTENKKVLAVGLEARKMIGRTPAGIKYKLSIGERTAENIKIELGSAYEEEDEKEEVTMEITGRDLLTGLPKVITITESQIKDALKDSVASILEIIKTTLEEIPPELSGDIMDKGIMLTGGGALLKGLDKLIYSETQIPTYIAEFPLDCVAIGAGKCLDMIDKVDN